MSGGRVVDHSSPGTATATVRADPQAAWNATGSAYPEHRCMTDLVADQVRATPDAPAVFDGDDHVTYRELFDRASTLATTLRADGVTTDDVVGVHGSRCVDLVVALLGVQLAGAAYLPLEPGFPPDRLRQYVGTARADVVVAVGDVDTTWCPVRSVRITATTSGGDPVDPPAASLHPDNLAYVIYTSGSTGTPKGVGVPHRGLVNRLTWMQREFGLTPDDRVLQKTPFGFDVSVWEFFWPLMTGAAIVLVAPADHRDPVRLADLIEARGVTTVHFVPSMLAQFLDRPGATPLPSLRRVICSGEALPVALMNRAREALPGVLHNLYGPTEASIDVTSYRCEADPDLTSVPIGGPIANTRIHLVGPTGEPVAPGEVGEIHLAGVGLARGYLGRPALTAERFLPDPFGTGRMYRTGDLGRWRPDGTVEYLGRTDHQVKIRGNRVELGEIEAALEQLPSVRAAVVTSRTIAGHDQLVAYVRRRTRDDNGVDDDDAGDDEPVPLPDPEGAGAQELRDALSRRLPDFMVPTGVVFLARFPLTHNGKVDRKRLPAPVVTRTGTARKAVGADESALAAIWAEALDLDEVGVEDDFLSLGGDSIVALRIAAFGRHRGYHFTAGDVLEARTIVALLQRLDTAVPPGSPHAGDDPARSTGSPLPAVAAAHPDAVDAYPLTAMQAGMMFHSEGDADSRDYFQQTVLRWDGGPLDVPTVESALHLLVERHDVLRTVFELYRDDQPVQAVLAGWRIPLRVIERRGAAPHGSDPQLAELLSADRDAGFDDLHLRPPVRVTLLVGPDSTVLVLTHHHALLDGWSLGIVIEELERCYTALRAGRLPELTAPVPFRDYVAHVTALDDAELEAYWRPLLADAAAGAPLRLVGGRAGDDRTGDLRRVLDTALMARVRATAAARGLTLSSVVHACWAQLIGVYSGSTTAVFGSTVAGRPAGLPGVSDLVGSTINTVPVVVDLRASDTLTAVAARLQHEFVRRGDNELVPLPRASDLAGVADGSALFDSIVVIENYGHLGGNDLAFVETHESTGYPVVLVVDGPSDATRFRLRYRATACDDTTAAGLLADIVELLRQFADTPDAALAASCLVTATRSPETIGAWNQTTTAWNRSEVTLQAAFEAQVRRTPQAAALLSDDQVLSYAEVNRRANRVAHALLAAGTRRASRVGLCLHRGPHLLIAMLGILKAGAAYVPLAPDNPERRLRTIAEHAGLDHVVTEEALVDLLPDSDASSVVVDRIDLSTFPDVDPSVPCTGADLAYVIFTSGSTGRPKGVACHHAGLLNYLRHGIEEYAPRGDGGAPVFSSYGFDMIVPNLYVPLLMGQPVRMIPELDDVAALVDEVARHAPYCFIKMTPGHLALFAAALTPERAAHLAGTLVVGADTFAASLLRSWRQLDPDGALLNEYGPTEASVANSIWTCDDGRDAEQLPIGAPIANTTLYVLDRWGNPVPSGVVGELHIGGAACVRGYVGMPGVTGSRFIPDPFAADGSRMYATGDLGRWNRDGTVTFLGRVDGQMKIRGYRIEAGEVESVLQRDPAVRHVAVVARDQRLVAFVEPSGTEPLDTAALLARAAAELPGHMVPKVVVDLPSLPLDRNGKLDRDRLPEIVPDTPSGSTGREPGSGPEAVLCAVLAEALGLAAVGPDDNFFELGGDSLLTLKVVAGARRHGLVVTPRQVFAHPVVADLAAEAGVAPTSDSDGPDHPTDPAAAVEAVPLTPIQQWFTRLELPDAHHYNQSVTLEFDQLDVTRLTHALGAVVRRHPALRLRFRHDGHRIVQSVAAADRLPDPPVDVVDVAAIAPADRWAAQTEHADGVQAGLDLETGPTVRGGVYLGDDGGGTVLIVAHHLGIDTLSWPVFLRDLALAYDGRPIPAADAPLTTFAAMAAAATDEALDATPLDVSAGFVADSTCYTTVVDADTTAALTAAPAHHRVRVEDILLAALVAGGAESFGGSMTVDVERHGRDLAASEVDFSDTIGWFTAAFPLELAPSDTHLETLVDVKERLRALSGPGSVEQGGQLVFNYHGRADLAPPDVRLFRLLPRTLGAEKSGAQPRTHLLEIEAAIHEDRLVVDWLYSSKVLDDALVHAVAARFGEVLAALLDDVGAAGLLTGPSDFPLARVTRSELSAWEDAGLDIEDMHALTPMQSAMVMTTLLDPDASSYLEHQHYRLSGPVDPAAVERAWRQVARGHAALRSVVQWELDDGPVLVVLREVEPEFCELAGADAADPLAQARARPFDLTERPPVRWWTGRRADGGLDVVLSFHHVLLDGWSVGLLLAEFMRRYRAELAGRPLPVRPHHGLRRLRSWQRRVGGDSADGAAQFWRSALDGAPTGALPAARPSPEPGEAPGVVDVRVDAAPTRAIRAGLARLGVTVSTLAHAAWALTVFDDTGADDVVVGSVVSGRSHGFEDVGDVVGMLVNTLPFRVRVDPGAPVEQWLAQIQRSHLDLRSWEDSDLADVAAWTAADGPESLFRTIVAVENVRRADLEQDGSALHTVDSTDETGYPLTVLVYDEEELGLRIAHDGTTFGREAAARLVGRLQELVIALAAAEEARVADVVDRAVRHSKVRQ